MNEQRFWNEYITYEIPVLLIGFPPVFEGTLIAYINEEYAVYGYVQGGYSLVDGWVGSWSAEILARLEEKGYVVVNWKEIFNSPCEFQAVIWPRPQ